MFWKGRAGRWGAVKVNGSGIIHIIDLTGKGLTRTIVIVIVIVIGALARAIFWYPANGAIDAI